MSDAKPSGLGKIIRAVVSPSTPEEAQQLRANPRKLIFADLGFTEHIPMTTRTNYAVCVTCRAWVNPEIADLRVHRAFHDRMDALLAD